MSQEDQQQAGRGQEPALSAGAMLRAAREARGLGVEAIARSLRLSTKYVSALEAGDYRAFPAQPYVRVYLRAVARHLGVDPELALAAYLRETGQTNDSQDQPSAATSVQAPGRRDRPLISWPAAAFLLLVLAVMGIVARRMNQRPQGPGRQPPPAQLLDTIPRSGTDSAGDTTDASSSLPQPVPDSAAAPTPAPAIAAAESLTLTITVQKDSVWVQVFSDGKGWKGIVRSGRGRTFRAADSLNVHVGHNAAISYTLNGAPFTPSDNKGVAVFKVTPGGAKEWSLERWKTVFEGRL